MHHPLTAASCAAAIAQSGYRAVAFDMDRTLIRDHSRGCLRRSDISSYFAAASPDAVALMLELHTLGVHLAVATHSDAAEYGLTRDAVTRTPTNPREHIIGEELATRVLYELLPPAIAEQVYVVAYYPRVRRDTDPDHSGKRYHLRKIATHFGVALPEVLLFDDDPSNIEPPGPVFRTCLVDGEHGFRLQDIANAGGTCFSFQPR
eukprot:TRINITY_DN7542_c0_g1_i1.p1 TRINITY_DN7542_c0_g1~~TRINITY_DN7542_c0_g1_i1.p1  ORF type:complete len:205 (-),score=18.92 TRINITY_DN7542_c0_g1_i1:132-746(-)